MKKEHSVLEVLFPQVRAEILRLLFAPSHRERYVRELAGMSGLRLSTVQDELRKLSALQLVTSRTNRYHRFYRANRQHPLFRDLVHIVEVSERSGRMSRAAVRPRRGVAHRQRIKLRHLPPDRLINWQIFSKRKQT